MNLYLRETIWEHIITMKYRKDSLINTMEEYTVLQMVGATGVRKDVGMVAQTQHIVI